MSVKYGVTLDGTEYPTTVEKISDGNYNVTLNGVTYPVSIRVIEGGEDIDLHVTGLSQNSYEYTGSPIQPTVVTDGTVTLGTDFSVAYTNNINPGTATATVTGLDKYAGSSVVFTFTITEASPEPETDQTTSNDSNNSTDETPATEETSTDEEAPVVEENSVEETPAEETPVEENNNSEDTPTE